MERAQSAMIIRTAAGFILFAAGIGASISLIVRAIELAQDAGDWAIVSLSLSLIVEGPMLINCWVLSAVGWWLMYPRRWMSFLTAAVWFAVISGVWWVVFFAICVENSLWLLLLAAFLILSMIAISYGLWYGIWWLAHRDKGQVSNQIERQTETVEQRIVNKFAVGALVCGVCSMLLLHGGIVLSLLGVTLGLLSLQQIGRDQAQSGSGLAIAGAMCGGIGLVVSVSCTIHFFAFPLID